MHKPIEKLKQEFDYKEYAACPLLGINGNIMISHGKSDAETIANSIRATKKYLGCEIRERLEQGISRYGNL